MHNYFADDAAEMGSHRHMDPLDSMVSDPAVEIGFDEGEEVDFPEPEPSKEVVALGSAAITIPEDYGDEDYGDKDGSVEGVAQPPLEQADEGVVREPELETPRPVQGAGGGRPPYDPPAGGGAGAAEFDDAEPLYSGPQMFVGEKHIVLVSRAHPLGAAARRVAAQMTDSSAEWEFAPGVTQQLDRKYLTNSAEDRELFVKTTFPPKGVREYIASIDSRKAQNEMDIAPEVSRIIGSEAAQAVVQERGYDGIGYVAPIAATISDKGVESVAYQWQPGQVAETAAMNLPPEAVQKELDRLTAVRDGLFDVFQANGVEPGNLRTDQMMVDGNRLELINAERYQRFDPGLPAYEPGQVSSHQDGQWHAHAPHHTEPGGLVEVAPGALVTSRRSDEAANPVFTADLLAAGRVITVTNGFTGESTMIHIQPHQMGTREGEGAIGRALAELPSLSTKGAIAHVISKTDVPTVDERAWNQRLTNHLSMYGVINIKPVVVGEGKTVRLRSDTGRVEIDGAAGNRIYEYQPLPAQKRHLPPETT